VSIFDRLKKVFSTYDEVKELREKLKINPDNPSLHQRLAERLVKKGEYSEAIQEYYTAASLFDKGGFGLKAIAVLKQCLKIDPTNLETVKLLMKYQAENGLTGDAVSEFRKTMENKEFFASDKDREEFIEYTLSTLGDHPEVHAVLIRDNIEKGKFINVLSSIEKAIPNVKTRRQVQQIQSLLEQFEGDEDLKKELWLFFGFGLLSRGFRKDGLAAVEKVIEEFELEDEEKDEIELVLQYLESVGTDTELPFDPKKAVDYVREKEKEKEGEEYELSEKEGARVEEEDKVEEEEDLDTVINKLREKVEEEIGDEDKNARYNLGIAFKEMGLFEEAIREFEVARQDEGLYFPSSIMLLDCYEALGKYEEAVSIVDELLNEDIADQKVMLDLLYRKGIFLEAMGHKQEAKELFRQVYEKDSNFKDVSSRVESG